MPSQAKAEADRRRALETVNLLMEKAGSGAAALLDDPKRMLVLVAVTVAFFACACVRGGLAFHPPHPSLTCLMPRGCQLGKPGSSLV
jgi:hypothetical protein